MARCTIDHRQTFALEDGWLVRTVIKPDGSSYQHRCSLASYQAVAHYIDEHANDGVTMNGLWDGLPDIPCTQAAIALAFLKERDHPPPPLLPGLQLPDRGRPPRVPRP